MSFDYNIYLKQNEVETKKKRAKIIKISLILLVLIILSSLFVTFNTISAKGFHNSIRILKYFLNPNWDSLLSLQKGDIPYLMLETIYIAFLGTIIGAAISLPLAFLSSRNITSEKISSIGVVIITVIRTIPSLIYVLIFIQVGIGAVAGILAFSVTSVGMISKLFIESIENIDSGVIEALDASGCNTLQKIRYGILPQLSSNFLSTILYRFEINVKNATLLGMVGAGGIGAELIMAIGNTRWRDANTLLLAIIVVVITIEFLSAKLRNKLIYGNFVGRK